MQKHLGNIETSRSLEYPFFFELVLCSLSAYARVLIERGEGVRERAWRKANIPAEGSTLKNIQPYFQQNSSATKTIFLKIIIIIMKTGDKKFLYQEEIESKSHSSIFIT